MIHIYNKKDYYLPENFNELTGKQLLQLSRVMIEKNDDDEKHQLKVLHVLLDISLYDFFSVHTDTKERMLPLIDWVFGDNTLTVQLLPEYSGFYGPKSEFDNLTLGEFHYSESYYRALATGGVTALDNLVAVLYRVPVKDYDTELDAAGDIRIAFNANELAFYANKIAQWPVHVKMAIVTWYDGCRQNLIDLYDEVFSAPGTPDHTEEEAGMYSVIRNLSGDKFGLIKDVEKVYVHHAFLEIEKVMEDNRRAEAELKSNIRS